MSFRVVVGNPVPTRAGVKIGVLVESGEREQVVSLLKSLAGVMTVELLPMFGLVDVMCERLSTRTTIVRALKGIGANVRNFPVSVP